MIPLFALLALSLAVCVALTPLVSALAIRLGVVDHPDGRRKMQARGIPAAGGVAVLLATALAPTLLMAVSPAVLDAFAEQAHALLGLLLASLIICAVGVADDCGWLRGRHKVLGQLLAVAIVIGFGLEVRSIRLFNWQIELGFLAVPFTVFWLLGAINSLNLIDGMDGLLCSVGLIICLALVALAVACDRWPAAFVGTALAGALLGFLRYNFPPASIFLGDSGSMLIGLIIGVLAIQSSLKGPTTIALAAPLAILTIPVFDTTAAILRRTLTGRSIYSTDRAHLHHCLLRRGLSSRRVLLCISCCCLLTVLGALASMMFHNEILAILCSLGVVTGLVATRLFGYVEFQLIKKRLVRACLLFLHLPGNSRSHRSEVHLQGSGDWKDLVEALAARAFDLNLKALRLDVNAPAIHEGYHAAWDRFDEELENTCLWRAEIPLAVQGQTGGRLEVSGYQDDEPIWKKIAMIVHLLEKFEDTLARPRNTNGEKCAEPSATIRV
jgi:UDP-GlcNAc:undecaprenyl-phosphate GlcNAc-1-phosphate transferase